MASPEATTGLRPGGLPATYGWLWFAVLAAAVPLLALAVSGDASWSEELHPAINAMLNGTSGVFLIAGFVAIRRKRRELHRLCMLTAVSASGLFLISYVIRFATTGAHKYPGTGLDKTVYLAVLFSHMVLAVVLVPLALTALIRALRGNYARHRRIARWAWPVWIYVSVTGVVVYLMLYPVARALYG
jgi:putative membrane protein